PESYPGQELLINLNVYVMPVFKQVIKIVDDLALQKSEMASRPEPASINNDVENKTVENEVDSTKPVENPSVPGFIENDVMSQNQVFSSTYIPAESEPEEKVEELSLSNDDSAVNNKQTEMLEMDGGAAVINQYSSEIIKTPETQSIDRTMHAGEFTMSETSTVDRNETSPDFKKAPVSETLQNPTPTSSPSMSDDIETPANNQENLTIDRSKMKVVRTQTHDFWDEE
ncbi:MAG: hypothetical protein LWX83_18175, partial [Anaerolineae bacterium]|nr:hypothetical protein [Anaerolineae bacterium]